MTADNTERLLEQASLEYKKAITKTLITVVSVGGPIASVLAGYSTVPTIGISAYYGLRAGLHFVKSATDTLRAIDETEQTEY